MCGQSRVEDQFLRQVSGPVPVELDEPEDLVVLLVLAELCIGVTEQSPLGILGHEGQNALLTAAALGDIVLLQQRVLAVRGNRVEVQVEGHAASDPQFVDRVEPKPHQRGIAGRVNPATVLGQERPLRE